MIIARWLARRLPSPTAIALLMLLVAAFSLRVYGLNWDDGTYLHPDESFVLQVLSLRIHVDWPPSLHELHDPATSGLNPRSVDPETGKYRDDYAYGALPLLVTTVVLDTLRHVGGGDWDGYFGRGYLVGRSLSALLDTLTVLVVYRIARRAASRRGALLAAVVAACAPMSIQLAHFFTTDSWLTFFVALCLLCAIRAAEAGLLRWYAAAGVAFGLAMATKGSVFTLAGLLAAAAVYDLWRRWSSGQAPSDAIEKALVRLLVSAAAALVPFALFEPYALMKPGVYLSALGRQVDIVRGTFDVPYTRQYIGTVPVVYQLEQFVRWGFGPVAGVTALAGACVMAVQCWRRRSAGQALILAWFLGYGLITAVPETKFLRYLAPLVPVLAVMAGLALDALWSMLERLGGHRIALIAATALVAGIALWTAAFESIYAHDNTRIAASRWIVANVPAGSTLSADYWDDALPKDLGPGLNGADLQYATTTMDLYADAPPSDVAGMIYKTLAQVDYVVLSSNRVSRAMPQSPWRYPVQTRYFALLKAGRLGFTLAAHFERPPSLGPFGVPDQSADESFINYDHPEVLIYKKEHPLSRPAYDQMMSWSVARPWSATREEPRPSLLLDGPVGEQPVVVDARWSERLTSNSLAALGVWIVFLLLLQVVGWPLTSLVFNRFADAGWGLSRLVSLIVTGYLVWLGASIRLISFRAIWAAATVAVVGAVGWAVWRRWRGGGRVWTFSRWQPGVALGAEVTFWGVFALFLLFRYLNPDSWHPIWGGEKPMEFAHLNATLRSAHFPPYDPWYVDGYINYYYYGLYLVAFCLKLTGIPSEIGFNLAQPTVIALLASAGYTVAATLGGGSARRPRLPIAVGAVGALLLVGIGNLATLRELLSGDGSALDPFSRWTWDPSRAVANAITEFPYFTALYADLHAHVVALPITVLAIALCFSLAGDASGVVDAVSRRGTARSRLILGLRLGLLALVLGTLSATNAWDVPVYAALASVSVLLATRELESWWRRLVAIVGLGLPLAFGSYALFLPFFHNYVALFSALGRVRAPTPFGQVSIHLGGLVAIVTMGLVCALLPSDTMPNVALGQPVVPVIVVAALILVRTVVATSDSAGGSLLGAGIVAVMAVVLALAAWEGTNRLGPGQLILRGWPRVTLGVGLASVVVTLMAERVVLAGFLALATAALAVAITRQTTALRFVGLMVAAAAAVGAGTELVVVADDLIATDAYRMNTVFKFYNQIWVLLALSGAALIGTMAVDARLGSRLAPDAKHDAGTDNGLVSETVAEQVRQGLPPRPPQPPRAGSAAGRWGQVGLIVTAMVVASSILYPLFATVPRLDQRFTSHLGSGTLNGLDWMNYGTLPAIGPGGVDEISFAGDRAAIDWFNRNVPGSPVIAEASIGPYRCDGSRISIGTGLPTIIGWQRHEEQQRYAETLPGRVEDVRRLYSSADPAEKLDILRRYDVAYVVVGDLERLYPANTNECTPHPSPDGIAAFTGMVGSSLDIAFAKDRTTIYRVRPVTSA